LTRRLTQSLSSPNKARLNSLSCQNVKPLIVFWMLLLSLEH